MRVKYETGALADLEEMKQYYLDVGGRHLALRMVRRIRAEIALLADNSYIAPAYDLVPDLRRLVVADGAFLVFYRVGGFVQILHVRRAERMPVESMSPDGRYEWQEQAKFAVKIAGSQ